MSELDSLEHELQSQGQRSFASWNAAAFSLFTEQRAIALLRSLRTKHATATEAQRMAVVKGYLQITAEGIGLGWVKETPFQIQHSLLEYLLWIVIPGRLPELPIGDHLPTLARVWNLCEGLRNQPAWVERFVLSHPVHSIRLEHLEHFLISTLEPIFSPPRTVEWKGKWRTNILECRPLDDEFLPGKMSLIAPLVVQVEDRERAITIAVMLQPDGKSNVFGPLAKSEDCLPATQRAPVLSFSPGTIEVAGTCLAVPNLNDVENWTVAESGFMVVSAVDSQRLWVLECSA